jgi:hypothetical protein
VGPRTRPKKFPSLRQVLGYRKTDYYVWFQNIQWFVRRNYCQAIMVLWIYSSIIWTKNIFKITFIIKYLLLELSYKIAWFQITLTPILKRRLVLTEFQKNILGYLSYKKWRLGPKHGFEVDDR